MSDRSGSRAVSRRAWRAHRNARRMRHHPAIFRQLTWPLRSSAIYMGKEGASYRRRARENVRGLGKSRRRFAFLDETEGVRILHHETAISGSETGSKFYQSFATSATNDAKRKSAPHVKAAASYTENLMKSLIPARSISSRNAFN